MTKKKNATSLRSLQGSGVLYALSDLLFLWPERRQGMMVCRVAPMLRVAYNGVRAEDRGRDCVDYPISSFVVAGYVRNWRVALYDEMKQARGVWGMGLSRLNSWIDTHGWGFVSGEILERLRAQKVLEWEVRTARHIVRYDALERMELHTRTVNARGAVTAVPCAMTVPISRDLLLEKLQEGRQQHARISVAGGE